MQEVPDFMSKETSIAQICCKGTTENIHSTLIEKNLKIARDRRFACRANLTLLQTFALVEFSLVLSRYYFVCIKVHMKQNDRQQHNAKHQQEAKDGVNSDNK